VELPFGLLSVVLPNGLQAGAPVTLAIRPEHVTISPVSAQAAPVRGKITSKNYLGDAALLEVEVNGVTLLAKLAGDSELVIGQEAAVELPAHRWRVFPYEQ
jgi:ABC-type sugar transport system ATPase subunit